MSALSEDEVADLARKIAEFEERLRSAAAERDAAVERQTAATLEQFRLETELRAALDRQKASAEILRSISATSGNAEHALRQIAETTAHFFNAPSVTIRIAEGDQWVQDIRVGSGSLASGTHPGSPLISRGASLPATVYQENRQIHIPDLDNVDPSMAHWPALATRAVGIRTVSGTPLRREGKAIGALIIYRDRLAPFTSEELDLQQSFADQAVIAIENARLFNETQEALERQTATSDILRVINNSTGNLAPVFESILEKAHHLCGAPCGSLQLYEGDRVVPVAIRGMTDAFAEHLRRGYPITAGNRHVILATHPVQRLDLATTAEEEPDNQGARAAVDLGGLRTLVAVPLLRNGTTFGRIVAARQEVRAFTDKQITLLQGFADQAVIAIENARLFNETQEALERQTATSDILRVINNSTGNLAPVFESILEKAHHLCGAPCGSLQLFEGDRVLPVAIRGMTDGFAEYLRGGYPISEAMRSTIFASHPIQHIDFVELSRAHPGEASLRAAVELGHIGTMATVPLVKDGVTFGRIVAARQEMRAFTDKQMALLQSFADQAVIAIENARLFNETKEALERQTATADILKVIASSPSDVQPVFEAIAESARRLLGSYTAVVTRVVDGVVHLAAGTAANEAAAHAVQGLLPYPLSSERIHARVARTGELAVNTDVDTSSLPQSVKEFARTIGWRSMLVVPMLRNGIAIGTIGITRREAGSFDDKTIDLLNTFADQAVIAIENARLFNETKEALERQTATADILKVIASSPSDVQPVFDEIATSAKRLLGGFSSTVYRFIDGMAHLKAFTPTSPEADEILQSNFPRPVADVAAFRMTQSGDVAQIPDTEGSTYELSDIARARGYRSMLFAPLMNKGVSIGFIAVTRVQPGSFSDHHVQLLQTFADQAVIAIENVRLFDEVQARTKDLQESLQQQTATADVLKVISRSAFDLQAVLHTLVESAARLCGADQGTITRQKDGKFYRVESFGHSREFMDYVRDIPVDLDRGSASGRALLAGDVVHIADVLADPEYTFNEAQRLSGLRTCLGVPVLREGVPVGVLSLTRSEVRPFSDKQIELVKTFADQAVIAIENARLFDEVQAKTRDLEEALQVQTASAEVLKVISRSPDTLQPVFDVIVETSRELCRAQASTIFTLRDGRFYFAAFAGAQTELTQHMRDHPISIDQKGSALARSARERRTIHIPNTAEDPEFGAGGIIGMGEPRATLTVPLMREGQVIGGITLRQPNVTPFTQRQIEAIETFADQAVIAIENTRLFDEVQAKTRDLEESLQQQTATSEVLQVISASPGELAPVFEKMLENATRVCGAGFGSMVLVEGDMLRQAAFYNAPAELAAVRTNEVRPIHPLSGIAAAVRSRRVVQVEDIRNSPSYLARAQHAVELAELGGARTLAVVPMVRDDEAIGVITVYRQEVRLFGEKQIDLLTNFARQAVIAIENARLLGELRQRTADLSKSLEDLRTAQGRLIQTEKLASLGQLTAGIAHEIKNPLNFVNNFSALSIELTDELNDLLKQAALAETLRGEVEELTTLLKDNLSKVVQHGKRADSIVKNMLLHSREGSGEHRPADVNALVDESLNLAYHGARAEKPHFNVTLERDFDPEAGMIEVFPQEITRVLLNLITNGFYAVTKRKADNGAAPFEPLVTASTKGSSGHVEIRIRDNGTGIPPDVKEKMFNPFFTTKPAGEGTGLGLSMSHDIIVKQHGGTIDVETEPGVFTEFTIVLPRNKK